MTKPLAPEQRRRPKGVQRTTAALPVRWSTAEAETIRRAAEAAGTTASDLVRQAALARAAEILPPEEAP